VTVGSFIDDSNLNIPPGLSRIAFEHWASEHSEPVICSLPYAGKVPAKVPCNGPPPWSKSEITPGQPEPPRLAALALQICRA
jgi:hypothetical protein